LFPTPERERERGGMGKWNRCGRVQEMVNGMVMEKKI
jgi:hypothetical protein